RSNSSRRRSCPPSPTHNSAGRVERSATRQNLFTTETQRIFQLSLRAERSNLPPIAHDRREIASSLTPHNDNSRLCGLRVSVVNFFLRSGYAALHPPYDFERAS